MVVTPAERLVTTGRRSQDTVPSLISVSTSKAMGAASGTFVIQMKPSRAVASLFEQITDDDWVDISIYRHAAGWHTMRGLVDEIRRTRNIGGSGATSEVFTISGRDFGKVWEITPVWFSPYANDVVSTMVASQVFNARPQVVGNPGAAARAYLYQFLEAISSRQGPDWELPPGIPGALYGAFLENIVFRVAAPYFQNLPARQAFNPGFMNPSGTLWGLAQQFSDPMFTELYADLLPDGDPFSGRISAGDPLGTRDMKMTVVLRDKPFPVVDPEVIGGPPNPGYRHPWGKVPLMVVPRQQIVSSDLGRSGIERFNAYMAAPVVYQETMGANALKILAPLLDRKDLQRHGFRRMDVASNMVPPDEAALQIYELANWQRRIIRDWYCLNPYMLNGSISLGIGRPDIRIGCRVIIPAESDDDLDETYYVEQVSHNWTFGTAVKTSLGVTRGWRGDDDSYIGALETQSAKYLVPELKFDSQVISVDPGIGSA
ncbi:MAG: hypothetical protein A2Y61_00235 [Chloroflexi bacterium RBG_13_60_13]|nr:MAG: hypothetical protein A2Y61_00235 [Chloroflexi bacterium RBG_13_60_13]